MAAGTPTPDGVQPGDEMRDRGRAAAARAADHPLFPTDEIDRLRAAAAALAVPDRTDDIRAAVAAIEEHAHVDPDPPVDANRREAAYAKRIIGRLVRFSNHHLAAQVSGLGWSVTWFGRTAAERIEALEREVADLRARLDGRDGPLP